MNQITSKEVRKTCIKMRSIRRDRVLCFMFVVWSHGYKTMEINTHIEASNKKHQRLVSAKKALGQFLQLLEI